MDEAKCIKLLEEHGVKPTANRIMVVKALASSIQPQSLAELESRIETIDKSNVFRALTLFREHHLVHAIEGTGDGTRFVIVTTTTMTTTCIPTSIVKSASRPIVLMASRCPRCNCPRDSSSTHQTL